MLVELMMLMAGAVPPPLVGGDVEVLPGPPEGMFIENCTTLTTPLYVVTTCTGRAGVEGVGDEPTRKTAQAG
jgi:hypothetical protein